MAELLIRIKANLLVYEFIAKLLDYYIRYFITILCLKNSDNIVIRFLLVNIESVCKLIASSNKRFFGINSHINDNLKFILIKLGYREFQFGHILYFTAPLAAPSRNFHSLYVEAWH